MPHALFIIFLFALGACIGSFLNVVIWRLPRGESLITPPSHCPKCNTSLRWYDNIPVFGWIALRGRCRYCKAPISPRYPIVEAVTGGLFVLYYVLFFMLHVAPCGPTDISRDWPIYGLYMLLISGLLASSVIDAELFIIPIEIPWVIAAVAILVHAGFDSPDVGGALNASPPAAALAAGGGFGLLISIAALKMKWLPIAFPEGEPMLEVDRDQLMRETEAARREGKTLEYEPHQVPPEYTKSQIRSEINKEMLFLMPPLLLGGAWLLLTHQVGAVRDMWSIATRHDWLTGLLGSVLGALVGAFVVWITRILGTLGFGRVAMGLGDVHLMFGVGAVIGASCSTIAFFIAPFFGILIAIYRLVTRTRRELPYGPYLSLATAFVMLFCCQIEDYLRPGLEGLVLVIQQTIAGQQP